jgi:hypothetical protein
LCESASEILLAMERGVLPAPSNFDFVEVAIANSEEGVGKLLSHALNLSTAA